MPLEAGDHDGAVRASVRREAGLEEAVEQLESHLPLAAVGADFFLTNFARRTRNKPSETSREYQAKS